ncbi:hypothetical protein [Lysinibacillus boronitolerans]|uniref:hypothetical protein n=1 Tax=Lysinibacillus boronitolerans TaxID=309788 RepID=UPI0002FF3B9F|nr:hypothetical protein [Lysinibacillus boronitolerans]
MFLLDRAYGLGEGGKNVKSKFNSASVKTKEFLLSTGNQTILNEISDWEEVDQKTFEHYVVDSLNDSIFENTFTYKGLVSEFSKIQSIDDINSFANKYGLLGLSHPNTKQEWPTENGEYDSLDAFYSSHEISRYGFSELMVEPVELWFKNVQRIQNLMKLYRLLKRYHAGNVDNLDGELIEFKQFAEGLFQVYWYNGEVTSLIYSQEQIDNLSTESILRELLIRSTLIFIQDRIKVAPEVVDSSKMPLGFYVTEIPTSKQLLNAIYFDLWKMLSEDVTIEICLNPECNLPFIKNKRQEYCSNSCKQQAYRNRRRA